MSSTEHFMDLGTEIKEQTKGIQELTLALQRASDSVDVLEKRVNRLENVLWSVITFVFVSFGAALIALVLKTT